MPKKKPIRIIEETQRVDGDGYYYLIVPHHAAGSPLRYAVYLIPLSPSVESSGGVRVVGRELPLETARDVARELIPKKKGKKK
jgi:hypothetical protein